MNYQKLHDSLIERARHRTERINGVVYHLHHILPRHEGGAIDSEVVLVTLKEHYIIRHLRYKLTGTLGNKLAWLMIKSNWKYHSLINFEAGKAGGASTRKNNSGIFREDLQYLRSEWAMIGANALNEAGTRSGICGKEWREQNKDIVFENSSKGGKIGGKAVGSMLWWNNGTINKKSVECPSEGWVRGMLMSEKKKAQVYEVLHNHPVIKCLYCDKEDAHHIISNHQLYCINNSNRKTTETFQCEYCYKEYTKGNYARFHGDKCKQNKNTEEK